MTARYPRCRDETGPFPGPSEINEHCRSLWGAEVTKVRRAGSQCVFICDLPSGHPVVFRANPGWDGPSPPGTIVEFVDHLARRSAPCPSIIPTTEGCLCRQVRDFTVSLETFLEGTEAERVDNLHDIGCALTDRPARPLTGRKTT